VLVISPRESEAREELATNTYRIQEWKTLYALLASRAELHSDDLLSFSFSLGEETPKLYRYGNVITIYEHYEEWRRADRTLSLYGQLAEALRHLGGRDIVVNKDQFLSKLAEQEFTALCEENFHGTVHLELVEKL